MDLTQHLGVIWRRRWVVLGTSVLVAGLVLALSSSRPDVYRAEAVVRVPAALVSAGDRAEEETLFLARTYAALATAKPVLDDAVRRSGLALDADAVAERVSATADKEVGFITLSATGPTPAAATGLTRGVTDALVAAVAAQRAQDREVALAPLRQQATALEEQLRQAGEDGTRTTSLEIRYGALLQSLAEQEARATDIPAVVTPAQSGDAPVSPTPRRDTVLALVAALVVNAELAVFVEARSDRFPRTNQAEEVKRITGLPVLAEVPLDVAAGAAEAFNSLRTNLMFMGASQPLRTVVITSVGPGAGKSYCALGLARSAADLELSVVLVDADLRRPALHARLGLPRSPGLSERLSGDKTHGLVQLDGAKSLRFLAAGAAVADPSALLSSRLNAVLADFSAALIVVDSPPAALFADAVAMGLQCDASVVVVDVATSRRRDVRRLVDDLHRVGANPLGVVLNRVVGGARPAYYYAADDDDGSAADPARPTGTPPAQADSSRQARPAPRAARPRR
ncbi:MAG: hypothetical protein ACRD1K_20175 [Acidimicrobiales bacterium]